MIRINEIKLSLDEDESLLKKKASKILKINEKYRTNPYRAVNFKKR